MNKDKTMKKVEVESQRWLLDDFFKVEQVSLRHQRFDGSMSPQMHRLNFERGNGVGALLCDWRARRLVLVRQFRYPAWTTGHGWPLEVVAGMLTPGADPEAEMRREILEETGYRAEELEFISDTFLSPGGSSERLLLYCASIRADEPVQAGGGLDEEGEDIEVVGFSFDEGLALLEDGQIADAKTLIALMWLRHRLLDSSRSPADQQLLD
jgi:nudix-type nucleoside diphosphatase (YffH/AdpP family)